MNLKDYEQIKFELAEIIRSASLIDCANARESEQCWRNLLTRLAEDRFNVTVAGRFNRGKSSLMNALFGLDRLPTGIVPLTSVITTVRYGTSERVLLDYEGTRLRGEAHLEELAEYITEKGNPGNQRQIRSAEIQLPAEILRRGFFFVDTPGLGSAIFENSQTTKRFIPEIDVLILVTSYESPFTEDEIQYVREAASSVRAVFVVVNKQDAVAPEDRQEVLDYVQKAVRDVLDAKASRPFSVSARDGLLAKQSNDRDALRNSGILDFEEELVRFLTTEKAELFLLSMCDRVLAELNVSLPADKVEDLASKVVGLKQKTEGDLTGRSADITPLANEPALSETGPAFQHIAPCVVCTGVMKALLDYLRRYQYDLSTQPEVQREHAEKGGFCALHTWHYEQITSPRGVCTAYPMLLNRVAARLRRLASSDSARGGSGIPLIKAQCPACKVRWEAEDKIIDSLVIKARQTRELEWLPLSAICLPHLQELLKRADNTSFCKYLLLREAALLERTAEDMQRYAIRHDALRRWLASDEERTSPLRALQLLVGHRNVNAIFTIRDIL